MLMFPRETTLFQAPLPGSTLACLFLARSISFLGSARWHRPPWGAWVNGNSLHLEKFSNTLERVKGSN